jgi:hypothetical protein
MLRIVQSLKCAVICRYTIPELLFVPAFHKGTYQYINVLYPFTFFQFFCRNILVSLLRSSCTYWKV